MKRIEFERMLEEVGLTKSESKVYLALLELGMSTKTPILRKSMVSSSIIYEILEKLVRKGLASSIVIDKTKYFQANEPSMLLEFLERDKRKIDERIKIVKKFIPLLRLKKEIKEEMLFASIYKGLNGLKAMLEEVVEEEFKKNKTKQWLAMGVTAYKKESFNRFWINWHGKIRPKYKVKAQFIFCERGTKYFHELRKTPLTEVRYVLSSTPVCVTVVGSRTLIMKYTDIPSFLLIRSEDVANSFTQFFNVIWKSAKM
ncbi:MAG: helix-turn-helix domain-containing protein [Candidatus Aenigmarchaeota archaeon]|nr:helix-turn-helix domain-containing protein [Candidatus Aenigmarchaeota archaeon]